MAATTLDSRQKLRSISAKIPVRQWQDIDDVCKANNMSRSDFVRLALAEAIDRYCDESHKEYPELTAESVIARFELCPIIMSLRKARRPEMNAEKVKEGWR